MFLDNETVTLIVLPFYDLFMLFGDYPFVDTSIPFSTWVYAVHTTTWYNFYRFV